MAMKHMAMNRPLLRELFCSAERRPEVLFYTSNIEKFLQARLVFQRSGLPNLRHYPTHTEPYQEDYSLGKDRLLAYALEQITQSVGRNSLLFVEDTSLRIDALSQEDSDVPGLAVKEWFSSTSFADFDRELRSRGDLRRATVKSDIALHIPGLGRPIFFHGETRGVVAPSAPHFEASIQYPWLTPKTFNGWFIPEGSERRLGEMSLEESWKYDFRIKALLELVDRLEEFTAVLNLPSSTYSRKRRGSPVGQLFLVPPSRPVFVVVGKTCAGKTTFGERALAREGYQWLEASDVIQHHRTVAGSSNAGESMSEFAKRTLQEKGQDFVARRLVQFIEDEHSPVVITGFRTLEEIEFIKQELPQCTVVLIEATERTRFERYLKRARPGSASEFTVFQKLDQEQWDFGLLRVAEDFADFKIANEGVIDDYFQQIDAVIDGNLSRVNGVTASIHSARKSERSQLVRCLNVLEQSGQPLDCNQVSDGTADFGKQIRFNNVNKILKMYPELAQRIEIVGHKVMYKITDSGRTYLRMSHSF